MSKDARAAEALRARLLGTWKLRSWTRKLAGSLEEVDAFGPSPTGYINYSPDGRVMVFVLRGARPRPCVTPLSDEEKIALFDSMFSYTGTYVVEADRVVHTIDASWNELWTGTHQTRFIAFEGERLLYTSPETADPMDGRWCTYKVAFERL